MRPPVDKGETNLGFSSHQFGASPAARERKTSYHNVWACRLLHCSMLFALFLFTAQNRIFLPYTWLAVQWLVDVIRHARHGSARPYNRGGGRTQSLGTHPRLTLYYGFACGSSSYCYVLELTRECSALSLCTIRRPMKNYGSSLGLWPLIRCRLSWPQFVVGYCRYPAPGQPIQDPGG
ncbi:uncharacterized protein F5Z01DRAFT_657751 [Emericellopsis atlantica]|uniref:Uncharacterized protein n=1 Tax=Emericellopsis atlantica TaxID=2614577 RepID=A0A9P7ZL59_9HYPO|nr:uncharacterized protein F5Z01DRAFT_657751 [Emericellopsis atlantica]KAG9253610.1 hypothetical protein F5Z01DRAFT_657751 [Emericellopsis atlantica]